MCLCVGLSLDVVLRRVCEYLAQSGFHVCLCVGLSVDVVRRRVCEYLAQSGMPGIALRSIMLMHASVPEFMSAYGHDWFLFFFQSFFTS